MKTVAKSLLPMFGFGLRHRLEGAEMALRAALAQRDEYLRQLNAAFAERDELQRQRDYFRGELERLPRYPIALERLECPK